MLGDGVDVFAAKLLGTFFSPVSGFPLSFSQRPYDIHASNSVESLMQLFSTVSVQYSPAWPKDLVSLMRKVSLCRKV